MAENIITNANDVEIFLEGSSTKRGTADTVGRLVVDEFSVTREDGSEAVHGIDGQLPKGVTKGNIDLSWSFTIMGYDAEVADMFATAKGETKFFSFTARKLDENGNLDFEIALDTCWTTSDEFSGSSGDPTEVAVEGGAVSYDRS